MTLLGLAVALLLMSLRMAEVNRILKSQNDTLASHTRSLATIGRTLRLRPMPMRVPDVRDRHAELRPIYPPEEAEPEP